MIYTLKKLTISIASIIVLTTNSYGGFFDFDPDGARWSEQLLQTAELVEQTKKQADQLLAQTGIRNIISFKEEMQQLMDFMDKYSLDFMDLTNDIIDHPKSKIGAYAKKLFEHYNLFDDCNYDYMNKDQKRICKSEMVRNVQEIATYQHTTQKLKKILNNLKKLSNKRQKSKDVKEAADISNAIQMQLAQLEIIKTQVEMMESQNRAKARIDKRQAQQIRKSKQNIPVNY